MALGGVVGMAKHRVGAGHWALVIGRKGRMGPMNCTRVVLIFVLAAGTAAAQPTRERGRFSLQGDPATLMAVDPETKFALIAFSNGTICVFPADQRTVSVFSFPIHTKAVTGAVFLPEATKFVTSSADGLLRQWDTAAARKHHKAMEDSNGNAKPEVPKPLLSVKAHSGYAVTCLAVSPDGKRLATGATDGTVKLWDPANLRQQVSLAGAHLGGVRAVQFSPDGKTLASGGSDKSAKLWDVARDKPEVLHKLEGHEGTVNAVAFSTDGKQLGVGSGIVKKSGTVHVWDAATGKPVYKLEGHEDVVTCLVFHPKTNHLASGGADKMIRVWDLKEKVQQYTDAHAEPLRNLVITPDGVRFGSCSDHAVRWWAGFGK
jgi:WD40 repeat protein